MAIERSDVTRKIEEIGLGATRNYMQENNPSFIATFAIWHVGLQCREEARIEMLEIISEHGNDDFRSSAASDLPTARSLLEEVNETINEGISDPDYKEATESAAKFAKELSGQIAPLIPGNALAISDNDVRMNYRRASAALAAGQIIVIALRKEASRN
jgi:hypothetical protein